MTKLKSTALKHLHLDLRNRFEGLKLDEDTSLEGKWSQYKDAFVEASRARLGKTRRANSLS